VDIEELKQLVAQDESENIEFKESTNSRALKEAGETLCGFLNNSGGSVFFGVTPKKNIIGQEVSEKAKKEIAENVLKHFEPHAPIQVEYIAVGKGKVVIALHVNIDQSDPPYYFHKIPYYRSQSSTQIMTPTKQQALLDARKWAVKSWESLPAIGVTIDDLDHDEISKTILDGIRHNRIPPDNDPKNV
jgi:ATP-dependent DNA helicase RecG